MDEYYMKIALELAKKGDGKVSPNPLVGAVIVKDGKIIGQGYHGKYGNNHAEVEAFNNINGNSKEATIYVTLEPCSHYGKTPPCVDRIISEGISRVVIGMIDPNPLVSGRSVEKLTKAGVEVEIGVLEEECKKLNEVFIKYILEKKPFVLMKWAMSLDGKISTVSGESKWITGEKARKDVHKLRKRLTGIMVGINTVLTDDPLLTCRLEDGKNPIRIIVDSNLRIPIESNIAKTAIEIKTIVATLIDVSEEKVKALEKLGIKILKIKEKNKKVDLEALILELGNMEIDSILLEGGSTLNFSALESGIVDKVRVYISPKIIGGKKAKTPIGGKGIDSLKEAFNIKHMDLSVIGEDILMEGYVNEV